MKKVIDEILIFNEETLEHERAEEERKFEDSVSGKKAQFTQSELMSSINKRNRPNEWRGELNIKQKKAFFSHSKKRSLKI
jgi:hypothetical protein